mmetsp:Transcript_19698/g.28895  ORF Transcript_19698/g.28895 Transcript_19698/m.28895 type:complete len:103 (-) Transcript_19698:860-1168(-)
MLLFVKREERNVTSKIKQTAGTRYQRQKRTYNSKGRNAKAIRCNTLSRKSSRNHGSFRGVESEECCAGLQDSLRGMECRDAIPPPGRPTECKRDTVWNKDAT